MSFCDFTSGQRINFAKKQTMKNFKRGLIERGEIQAQSGEDGQRQPSQQLPPSTEQKGISNIQGLISNMGKIEDSFRLFNSLLVRTVKPQEQAERDGFQEVDTTEGLVKKAREDIEANLVTTKDKITSVFESLPLVDRTNPKNIDERRRLEVKAENDAAIALKALETGNFGKKDLKKGDKFNPPGMAVKITTQEAFGQFASTSGRFFANFRLLENDLETLKQDFREISRKNMTDITKNWKKLENVLERFLAKFDTNSSDDFLKAGGVSKNDSAKQGNLTRSAKDLLDKIFEDIKVLQEFSLFLQTAQQQIGRGVSSKRNQNFPDFQKGPLSGFVENPKRGTLQRRFL